MRRLIFFTLFFGAITLAQTPKAAVDPAATAKTGVAAASPSNARPLRSSPRQDSFSSGEFWTGVIIPPGGSINFDSSLDYSSSDSVRVTVLSANGDDLSEMVASAFWSIPALRFFNAAEVVTGEGSFYSDARFASFKVYGSEFRLRLTNRGAFPITLAQILIYTRAI